MRPFSPTLENIQCLISPPKFIDTERFWSSSSEMKLYSVWTDVFISALFLTYQWKLIFHEILYFPHYLFPSNAVSMLM